MTIQKIDTTRISTSIQGQNIHFNFITDPKTRTIHKLKDFLACKEKQMNFLQKEIYFMNIEQQLQSPPLQEKIKNFEHQFIYDFFNDLPNDF